MSVSMTPLYPPLQASNATDYASLFFPYCRSLLPRRYSSTDYRRRCRYLYLSL
jgi:hypothetical protein